MTADDEAFVRRIVDSPGDDLPRLIYADWLDDRGDPRGTYLRAEVEWARTVWAAPSGPDRTWLWPPGTARLPLMYGLSARRPSDGGR